MSESVLVDFKSEVLDKGPESTLPCNLPEKWLNYLATQAEEVLEGREGSTMSEVLAAVIHIFMAKSPEQSEIQMSSDDLFGYLQDYRIELALEEVRRQTDTKPSPASIETIFTNREVDLHYPSNEVET